MNFRIFEGKQYAADYAGDITRKQFNNNPTATVEFHLNKDPASVLGELKESVDHDAVDFSQINILDYDDSYSFYETLGVPSKQVYFISLGDDVESLVNDRIKTKENKGKLALQVVSIDDTGHLDVDIHQGLMKAYEIILVAAGTEKSEVIRRLHEENGKSDFLSVGLKVHHMVTAVLDRAAADGLSEDVKEYFVARLV